MKLYAALSCLLLIFCIAGCQPEVPPYNPTIRTDSTTTTAGTQLTRYVGTTGSDSTALNYTYNSAKQVIGIELLETSGTSTQHYFYSYTRNSAGLITRCIYTYLTNNVPSPDTATVDFLYSSGTSPNLITAIERTKSPTVNNNMTDSSLYTYNAAGQCTVATNYYLDYTNPGVYYLHDRQTYSYNGTGDVSEIKNYIRSNGQVVLEDSTQFSYDSKSPFITTTTAERFALYAELPYANHNMTQNVYKPTSVSSDPPSANVITHTYNSNNLPVTSKGIYSEYGAVVDTTYVRYYYR